MARIHRHSWVSRLIGAALSLSLIVASVYGAAAHANGCGHHDRPAHHDVGDLADDDGVSAVGHAHAGHAGPDAAKAAQPDATHAGCADFVCHCCVAALVSTPACGVETWSGVQILPWQARTLSSVDPSRLDRPPKSLVSA